MSSDSGRTRGGAAGFLLVAMCGAAALTPGCADEPAAGPEALRTVAAGAAGTATAAVPVTDAGADAPADPGPLSQRLLALRWFGTQMWPAERPDAPAEHLAALARGAGVTLTATMPEPVRQAESVATRRLALRADGDWVNLVAWLRAVENTPRRLVVRELSLHRLRNRSVAEVQLTAVLDRPAGLTKLARLDVSALRGAALTEAVGELDADLQQKSVTMTRLGADTSWSAPLDAITRHLPAGSEPVRLTLKRDGVGRRAQAFSGDFTVQLPAGVELGPLVATLRADPGFADLEDHGLRSVGAGVYRWSAGYVYGAPPDRAVTPPPGPAGTTTPPNRDPFGS